MFLLPSRVLGNGRLQVIRLGLVANVAIGAAAAFAACYAFRGFAARPEPAVVGDSALALFGSLLVGTLAARSATDETDKRLLRAAVRQACVAPAAHPDTVRAIEAISPYDVFIAASELVPPGYRFSREIS
jgi:hypothetical protein